MVRLASGVVLAAAAIVAVLFLPVLALQALVCVIAAMGAHEFGAMAGGGHGASRALLIAAVVLTCWWASAAAPIDPRVVLAALLTWVAVEVLALGRTMAQAAVGVAAPVYVGFPLGTLVAIHVLGGWRVTLLLLATVVVSDSAQYYTGRMLGRRPLAPTISPKKTVEGAIGGAVCAPAFLVIAGSRVWPDAALPALAALGAAIAVLGICGDLFESRLKRTAGIKDSSSLIPGHGGVLDRLDALLFATPAFYFYVRSLA